MTRQVYAEFCYLKTHKTIMPLSVHKSINQFLKQGFCPRPHERFLFHSKRYNFEKRPGSCRNCIHPDNRVSHKINVLV